jgi:hypothetical protein
VQITPCSKDGLAPAEIIERIQKALDIDKTHAWSDVVRLLQEGKAQIFCSEHGAWVTEIVNYPLKRCLNVWIVAGKLPEVMLLQDAVLRFAAENKCDAVYATARLGWKNVARAHGWKKKAMMIMHEVPNA